MDEQPIRGAPAAHPDLAAVQLLVPELEAAQQAAAEAARSAPGSADERVIVLDPAHISLGYPWPQPPGAASVELVAGRLLPVTVGLGALALFPPDQRSRRTLHVPVLDGGVLQDLAAQLGWTGLVTPHCSLVRSAAPEALERALHAAAPLVPTTVELTVVEVTARTDGGWHRLQRWEAGAVRRAPTPLSPLDGI